MGDLPQTRVEPSPPFTHVGVDCFGPYTVKDRRTELKRWGLLITCMYSRAVHIEILEAMSADSFINAIRRCICIRGGIKTIYCDNGTNFVGADNELAKEFETMNCTLKAALKDEMIEFKFNAPGASHAGGAWERQTRTIKGVLNGMITTYKGRMTTESLRTAFYESMSTVNSRPLTVDNLYKPNEIVITPNHLITMKPRQAPLLPGEFDKQEIYGRKQWRKVQMFAEEFWTEWKAGYIANITKRQKWTQVKWQIQAGDLVLIVDDFQPRNQWLTAIVEDTINEKSELPKRAKVRVASRYLDKSGKRLEKATILERPIQKLILLLPSESE
ncbi:uncharacterized protein [Watersipora subatra]|uniref:uncharacterized protein n=1 Tax=Watersipora subatra TaxID=2589382 RepID=UPI00355C8F91